MKKVLLSCLALAAGAAMAIAQDEPTYPSKLDFTLNGEKELPGVLVNQTTVKECLKIEISGQSDASVIQMEFETPEGWDGALIALAIEGADTPFITRSSHWLPASLATEQGYKKGNSFKFTVNGTKRLGTIYLVKGDQVWENSIDVEFNVAKAAGAGDNDEPVFPESFTVDTFNDGLEVTQGYNKWGSYDINVKGEVSANTFPIVIDVPEGWDGFICKNWSHEGDVTITENNLTPRGTRAEEIEWVSVDDLLAKGYEKGNRFTFEPTYVAANNNYQTIELHLYKGDKAMAEDILSLMVYVSKGEAVEPELPTFPDTFDLTTDSDNVTIWQGSYEEISESGIELTEDDIEALSMFMPEKAIVLNGTTDNAYLSVDFNLPEGWEGVLPVKVNIPYEGEDYNLLTTRANPFEPYPMDEFLGMMQWMSIYDLSIAPGKQLVFPIDGNKQIYGCLLYIHDDGTLSGSPEYAGDYVDSANSFVLVVNVKSDNEVSELEYPDHLDMTLNGETELAGVTVTQEMIPFDGDDYLTISINGTCDADEITIEMTTPEGWDGMLTFSDYGESEDEIEPLRAKVNMDEDSWIPLMFASWMGLTEGNTLTFKADGEEHQAMAYLVKGDNYYAVNIDFIFEVSNTGNAVESINTIERHTTYYDVNGGRIDKPTKGIYVKVDNGKASKVVVK